MLELAGQYRAAEDEVNGEESVLVEVDVRVGTTDWRSSQYKPAVIGIGVRASIYVMWPSAQVLVINIDQCFTVKVNILLKQLNKMCYQWPKIWHFTHNVPLTDHHQAASNQHGSSSTPITRLSLSILSEVANFKPSADLLCATAIHNAMLSSHLTA